MAEINGVLSRATINQSRRRKEELDQIRKRLARAKQVRENWAERFKLEELYERYIGDTKFDSLHFDHDDDFFINRFWPTIKTLLPSLFLQNPTFIIRSKNERDDPSSVLKAKMAEAVLSAIARQEFHLEFSVKLALLQSFFSIGTLKCIFEPKLMPNPRAGEPMVERTPSGIPTLGPDNLVQPVLGEDGEPMTEPRRIVSDETYRWHWVNSDKLLLPDAGPDHLRWPWVGEEVTVLLDEAREDDRFPRNLRTQLKANTSRDFQGIFASRDSNPVVEDLFTYVEYWDVRRRRHMIVAENQTFSGSQFLVNRPYPEGIEEHPYAFLIFNPQIAPRATAWPIPHVWNWLGIQKEYTIRRRQMMIGARRTARKVYYDDSTFPDSDQAIKALQSQTDMEAVKVNDATRIPVTQRDEDLPTTISQDISFIDSDWNRTTGVTGARTGGGRGRNTATETKIEQASGESRDLDMRHMVNVWLTTAGEKMLQLLQGTLTVGMYAKIRGTSDVDFVNYIAQTYGPELARNINQFPGLRAAFDRDFGNDRWVQVSREELEFMPEVSIAPGSARPRNMSTEKEDFFEILSILGSVPILSQSRSLLTRVADMFEFIDPSVIDEILAAGQRREQLDQMRAGRFQGNEPQQQPQPSRFRQMIGA